MKRVWLSTAAAVLALMTGACAPATPSGPQTLTVMTHSSFALSEDVIADFERENNAQIQILEAGDAGGMLNRALLSRDAPLADVIYGLDNAFLSRALDEGLLESYAAPGLAEIPSEFQLDPENRALPVDYGDVCLNFDKAWFAERGLALPDSLADLTQPEYRGLLVVQDPATSSPGLAFLLATVAAFGEDGYLGYWQGLIANEVRVADSWETAYYTDFSGSSDRGPRPLVVSYASSPPAEVIFADPRPADAPTASLTAPGMCYRQIEFVGILAGTPRRALAERWVDFMLSERVQADLPLQMFVFPVRTGTPLPADFVAYAQVPEQPASLDPALVAANRERWIQAVSDAIR
jgi:thiamine transport system substrate-binding protein